MRAALALSAERRWPITAILVRASAVALRAVPRANGAYRDGRFELYSRVNVGVVVATERAYLIPTVFDADRKPVADLTAELERLKTGAHAGELEPPAFSGATFTLSNVGELGVEASTIVVNSPQAAAIAAGSIRHAPVVRDGELVPGRAMTVTLACDHRILYGAAAARFLREFTAALTDASLLCDAGL
jgi:pyruvate dehydrogenase E2 component (dihydrolipoyllysine-residue acetyltransferase)